MKVVLVWSDMPSEAGTPNNPDGDPNPVPPGPRVNNLDLSVEIGNPCSSLTQFTVRVRPVTISGAGRYLGNRITVVSEESTLTTCTGGTADAMNNVEYVKIFPSPFAIVGSPSTAAFAHLSLTANTTYRYKIRALNTQGTSDYGPIDIATTVDFTDGGLAAGTVIKRAHITELRTAVNAVRAAAGLAEFHFTDPSLTVGVASVMVAHLTELRAALATARAALGLAPVIYTDPSPSAGVTPIRSVHVTEMRGGVQ